MYDRGLRGFVSAGPGPLTPDPGLSADRPPFGRSWAALYAAVAGTLAVVIVLLALFTRAFE